VGCVAGTVVTVRDGRAWVECIPEAAGCGVCASGRGCGWGRQGPGSASTRLEVAATLDGRPLQPGDSVLLEADDRALLAVALRLYLLPLAGLLAGPLVVRMAGVDAGLLPVGAALAGLALGGLTARAWTRRTPELVAVRRAGP
jgi:positive regulator of sigma E activity